MSGIPLSQKARSMTSSAYVPPPSTAAFSQSVNVPVETRINSAIIKKSNIQLDGTLRDIKRRYEDEARQVQQNYEVDFSNQISLIKNIEELQIILEEERRRSLDLENKYNAVVMELEKERRLRIDLEHDNSMLNDELRRAESIISEYELKLTRLQKDTSNLDGENKSLRNEIHRLTDLFNMKLREVEDKYLIQVKDLSCDVERFKHMSEQQRIEYENRLRDLDRDSTGKYKRLEDVVREKERLIAELESELRKLTDHITQLKIDYEEELRRQVVLVREEENHKLQIAIKNMEARIHHVEAERDHLIRKNQDLVREIHLKERQIQDLRLHTEADLSRQKAEIHDLRNKLAAVISANEKLHSDVSARDTNISRLEAEIVNLEREMNRLKEIHVQEVNRVANDHLNERRRWEEAERSLKNRISELERIVRALETENGKLRGDIERIKEQVTGNIHRTIFQTFVEYDATAQQNTKSLY